MQLFEFGLGRLLDFWRIRGFLLFNSSAENINKKVGKLIHPLNDMSLHMRKSFKEVIAIANSSF
jgi:hypothetical protein